MLIQPLSCKTIFFSCMISKKNGRFSTQKVRGCLSAKMRALFWLTAIHHGSLQDISLWGWAPLSDILVYHLLGKIHHLVTLIKYSTATNNIGKKYNGPEYRCSIVKLISIQYYCIVSMGRCLGVHNWCFGALSNVGPQTAYVAHIIQSNRRWYNAL